MHNRNTSGKARSAERRWIMSWNYHLPPQTARPIPKSHKKFDHCRIWTQLLPHLDFPKRVNTARTTQPDFSQRIDTVFFKRHVDDWKVRTKTQIQGDLDENPTGQALADLIHKEPKSLQKRSGVCKIKHGRHEDEQAKGENIETKHKTPFLKGSPY